MYLSYQILLCPLSVRSRAMVSTQGSRLTWRLQSHLQRRGTNETWNKLKVVQTFAQLFNIYSSAVCCWRSGNGGRRCMIFYYQNTKRVLPSFLQRSWSQGARWLWSKTCLAVSQSRIDCLGTKRKADHPPSCAGAVAKLFFLYLYTNLQ